MIKISFYLLNPKGKYSTLYVSLIGDDGKRFRFSTGRQYETYYFNQRKKKGKRLIKKNTELTLSIQHEIEDLNRTIRNCEKQIKEQYGNSDLTKIKEIFYQEIGLMKSPGFLDIYNQYVSKRKAEWSTGTFNILVCLENHLKKFESESSEPIKINRINAEFWFKIKAYFIAKGMSNNSINKNLKYFKRFIRYCWKEKLIKNIDIEEDFPYLDETEVLKIALKNHEVEDLTNLKITSKELDIHRDWFLTQIYTGQRVSDLPGIFKNLDLSSNGISIMQKKGGTVVFIPLFGKLREHLEKLMIKHPDGLPAISDQKYNQGIKEVIKMLPSSTQIHQYYIKSGNQRKIMNKQRYELVTTHTARRTFVTLGRMNNIPDDLLMKITGHKSFKQFLDYCKVDDVDLAESFNTWK
ncbi:MAG: site-specific integrase [Cyclobacteriaceae bacterium]|nr:site-specific integrase [Cyclobacteriaceae bacterium]